MFFKHSESDKGEPAFLRFKVQKIRDIMVDQSVQTTEVYKSGTS